MTTRTIRSGDLQLAGDFLARDGVTAHGVYVYPRSIGVMLNEHDYLSLRNVYAMLDDTEHREVRLTDNPTETAPHQVILSVDGDYRDMRASAQITVTEASALDLIRSFVDENGHPNAHLLDALAEQPIATAVA